MIWAFIIFVLVAVTVAQYFICKLSKHVPWDEMDEH